MLAGEGHRHSTPDTRKKSSTTDTHHAQVEYVYLRCQGVHYILNKVHGEPYAQSMETWEHAPMGAILQQTFLQ